MSGPLIVPDDSLFRLFRLGREDLDGVRDVVDKRTVERHRYR